MRVCFWALISVGLILVQLPLNTHGAEPQERVRFVKSAKLEGAPRVLLTEPRLPVLLPGEEEPRQLDVTLVELRYVIETVEITEGKPRTSQLRATCWELRSDDNSAFTWTYWHIGDNSALPRFFAKPDGRSILAWVDLSNILYAEVNRPTDRLEGLFSLLSTRESGEIQRIGVGALVPEVKRWGVNALYFDIHIVSLQTEQNGSGTLQISKIGSDKIITLVRENGIWRRQ